jgi:dethiobiotin synthetase
VATGAAIEHGNYVADDTKRLAESVGHNDYQRVTEWAFPDPSAPPVAARAAGTQLVLAEIAGHVKQRAAFDGSLLIEGVGGLLCPLTESDTIADLARQLEWPLVVVARRSLGTLNHTLMTLEVAYRRGLHVAGLVVCETTPVRGLAEETNVEELQKRIDVPLLAVVPYRQEPFDGTIASLAAVDWRGLMGA